MQVSCSCTHCVWTTFQSAHVQVGEALGMTQPEFNTHGCRHTHVYTWVLTNEHNKHISTCICTGAHDICITQMCKHNTYIQIHSCKINTSALPYMHLYTTYTHQTLCAQPNVHITYAQALHVYTIYLNIYTYHTYICTTHAYAHNIHMTIYSSSNIFNATTYHSRTYSLSLDSRPSFWPG